VLYTFSSHDVVLTGNNCVLRASILRDPRQAAHRVQMGVLANNYTRNCIVRYVRALLFYASLTGFYSGGAIASGVAACHWRLFVEFSNFKVAVIIWLVGAAIADVTAAAILVWYLVSIGTFILPPNITNWDAALFRNASVRGSQSQTASSTASCAVCTLL
jgi:hypothetical protein